MKAISALTLAAAAMPATASGQTHAVHDTATAYGARLDAKGKPADLNERRVNSRIKSRLDNRLALRIERYRPDNTSDPTLAFSADQTDKTHAVPVDAPAPGDGSDDQQ